MRQTSYLGILLKVTILILSLIQIDNIILYQALGLQRQKEKEALGLPLFISCILFFYIILYYPSIVLVLYYIILYCFSIIPPLYYIILVLSQHCIILSYYCPSIILYCPIIILALYYIVLALFQHCIILSYYYYHYIILSYYYLILFYYYLNTTIYFLLFTKIIVIGIYQPGSRQ